MSWFKFSRKKTETLQPLAGGGKACMLDTTIGMKAIWIAKNSAKNWEAGELKYKEEVQAYFRSITIGTTDSAGYNVTNILSRSDEFMIYEIKPPSGEYSLRIDIRTLVEQDELPTTRWAEVAREFYITKRVLFKVNDQSVRERIANIIARALSTGYTSEAVQDLKELQKNIDNIYSEKIQNSLKYLGTIIGITLSFVIFSMYVHAGRHFLNDQSMRLLIFSSTAGCIGGFFSVSIRLRKMTFEREIPSLSYVLYGFERMVISICASIIVLLAIKGGVAFEFAKLSLFSSLLLSVIAGFSETLIPNLLVKIESDNK